MTLAEIVLLVGCAPVLSCASYLFALALLSARPRRPEYPTPETRFDVVVPAHDEELHVASTVQSLLEVDYPEHLRRVLVVADNCEDSTAERARTAGATVLVRTDPERRGKGYALALAFEHSLREGTADAVVVVDADTSVSPNLLRAFAARLQAGAVAVQARYGVRNRGVSWRTRLMAIALALFHDLRSIAREKMRVSCGLRGNGMAFRAAVLREVPHRAFSIVEDLEYGVALGLAGHRVTYVDEAEVRGEMASSERDSRSQRRRWEGGRRQLARLHAMKLFGAALRKRSLMLFDLAMDLIVPPLSYVVLAALAGTAVAGAWVVHWHASVWSVALWGSCVGMLAVYVARGVVLSGAGLRGFVDLAAAPIYVAWKVALALRGTDKSKGEWVRTARSGGKAS